MMYSFEIGENNKHVVAFHYNPIRGGLNITVNGQTMHAGRGLRIHTVEDVERYEFTVGEADQHHVTLENRTMFMLAGRWKRKYTLFVDGEHVGDHEGY